MPFQGRTLHATDIQGKPIELYFKMDQAERMLQQYGRYKGCQPAAHRPLQPVRPRRAGDYDFYAALGFRLTEYAESEDAEPKIAAAWMHRKGGVHDLAFTNGTGPRLHHIA